MSTPKTAEKSSLRTEHIPSLGEPVISSTSKSSKVRLNTLMLDNISIALTQVRSVSTYVHPEGGVIIGRTRDENGQPYSHEAWGKLDNAVGRITVGNPPHFGLFLEQVGPTRPEYIRIIEKLTERGYL